jgi:hypothetical protein
MHAHTLKQLFCTSNVVNQHGRTLPALFINAQTQNVARVIPIHPQRMQEKKMQSLKRWIVPPVGEVYAAQLINEQLQLLWIGHAVLMYQQLPHSVATNQQLEICADAGRLQRRKTHQRCLYLVLEVMVDECKALVKRVGVAAIYGMRKQFRYDALCIQPYIKRLIQHCRLPVMEQYRASAFYVHQT